MEKLAKLYKEMLRIRRFEEKVAELLENGNEIKCPVHLYIGQEAVAVGVCSALNKDDYVFSTHRSHGHYLAKGGSMKSLMAEIFCKETGCSKGYGGSMHLSLPEIGFMGSSAIVAGTIPIAVGSAYASQLKGENRVSVAFFGDGATNEGVFYESLNISSLKKLPILFVCENNGYSTHMPIEKCLANTNIYKMASSFNIPSYRVNGNDVVVVNQLAESLVANIRNGLGCRFMECLTYRWRGHVGASYDLDKGIRSEDELKKWMSRCPIKLYSYHINNEERKKIEGEVEREVNEAVEFARQ